MGAAGFGTPVAVTGALLIGPGFPAFEASVFSLIANTAPVAFGALGTPIIALQGVTGLDLHDLSAMVGRQLPVFTVIIPFWLIWAYSGFRGMLQVWPAVLHEGPPLPDQPAASRAQVILSALPWVVLSVLVFIWGVPQVKGWLNGFSAPAIEIGGLDQMILRAPPVEAEAVAERAVFTLNWISATGTAIFIAAVCSGVLLRYSVREMFRAYWRTLVLVRHSLLTIEAMLGWLGVALTGNDTASNVLFGNLQTITAGQVGVSPTLMAAANSSGGVMGKMIDAQSIVVASTATKWYGHEGRILRAVFFHSLALAALVGGLVMLQAYVSPFVRMVVR